MKNFFLTISILTYVLSAYSQETKQVVIIKKTKNDKGEVKVEKHVATGEDADILLLKMKEDEALEGIDIEIEETITPDNNGKVIKKIRVEHDTNKDSNKNVYIIESDNGGEHKVIEWEGEGELPEDIKKELGEIKIKEVEEMVDGKMYKTITVETDEDMIEAAPNKVKLGIMVGDDSRGIVVEKVVDDSAAAKAGIQANDVILKIGNTYVFNMDMLLEKLAEFDIMDKSKITIIRDGKEVVKDIQF